MKLIRFVCVVLLALIPLHVHSEEPIASQAAESSMITIPNQYFDIEMDPAIAEIQNFNINEALDYVQKNISADFHYKQSERIPVVIYATNPFTNGPPEAQFKSDGDYDSKMRIKINTLNPNFNKFRSTLCHEYTHAVIQALTKGNLPRWLNEGLAEYEKFRHAIPPTLEYLTLAYDHNELISWEKINTAFDNEYNFIVNVAYEESFSFVYFLVQQSGMDNINHLLQTLGTGADFNSAFKDIYGMSLSIAQDEWKKQLPKFMYNYTGGKVGQNS